MQSYAAALEAQSGEAARLPTYAQAQSAEGARPYTPVHSAAPSPYRAIIENMFSVVNTARVTVPFKLSETQADLDARWTRRNLVTKVRQHAMVSSYIIARFTAKCLAEENRNCVIISHEAEATARLLNRARFIISHLRNVDRPPRISTDRSNALVFGETGSSFWIGTAGQRAFGRGDTISDLHLSEAAFYEDPERIRDGVFPAAELGEITVESTGNGRGNWFHRAAQRAREGHGFCLFFYPWTGLASCSLPLSAEQERVLSLSLDEERLGEQTLFAEGVPLSQLAWRRERILTDYDGDVERFKENYPRHFEECFRAAGLSFFPKVRYHPSDRWRQRGRYLWTLDGHPRPGARYVGGVDVGGGVEQDNSVLEVFDLDTGEQVAEWASAAYAPDECGREVARIGQDFNSCYLNVERNNHGLTTISTLVSIYPLERLHRGTYSAPQSQVALTHISSFGTYVSETTRGLLLGTARRLLTEWTIHSDQLNDELSTFIENRQGKFEASAGSLDDRVMAAAHALFCVERASIMTGWEPQSAAATSPDPFSFEALFPNAGEDKTPSRYGMSERWG